ncbi:hypothetical protein SAMN05880558_1238 [Aeromonas sp. RU39B]|nr:hypothetical protein SAMN05880558_1238 [Aeromonas sp. RU39B]
MLHVGDNKIADIEQAKKHGISTFYVPTTHEFAKKITKTIKSSTFSNKMVESFVHGLQSRNLARYPMISIEHGYTSGSVSKLGYSIFGPMFFGFAKSIIDQSIQKKHKKIYFLARDGEIVKKSYDILRRYYPEAPESEYLLASRRAINIASLMDEKDTELFIKNAIFDINKNPSPCLFSEFIRSRFGLKTSELTNFELLLKIKDESINDININTIEKILLTQDFIKTVTENAKQERAPLLEYFDSVGLNSKCDSVAFVDIGHNGTMQKGLSTLLGLKSTHGYYFATYSGITKNLDHSKGHTYTGFFRNLLEPSKKDDVYIYNALVFESAFLNDKGSFVKFKKNGKTSEPEYLDIDKEEGRIKFSRVLHAEIERFVDDFSKCMGHQLRSIFINPDEWCAPIEHYLSQPSYRDSLCFSGVTIENYFSGRAVRYIVPTKATLEQPGLWKNGTTEFKKKHHKPDPSNIKNTQGNIQKTQIRHSFDLIAKRLLDRKKYNKLINNPVLFFDESKHHLAKLIKHIALSQESYHKKTSRR